VVDYGGGNIRSVVRALTHAGGAVRVSADPSVVAASDRVVLPGQGAFSECMQHLTTRGLSDVLMAHIAADRPFLGICLGLQILFEESEEQGLHKGLGIFPGRVVRFESTPARKVPHMGWNTVHPAGAVAVMEGLPAESWFYFVHSYYVDAPTLDGNSSVDCARTEYGVSFLAAVARGNVFACQFHPEKSQQNGLHILERFVQ
jgi:glutamine amidotransferase